MTVQEFLTNATQQLQNTGITTARLDCLILLEDELARDRSQLLAHVDQEIPSSPLLKLNKKIVQRARHTPLAYIRGKAYFYGHEFFVDRHVLVPRPESEVLINLAKTLTLSKQPRVADVGCGSGCLGITAALELGATPHFYDISSGALLVAKRNSRAYEIHGQFYQQNLLEQQWGPYEIVFANLPYVPTDYAINDAAKHEPEIALFAGHDGLDLYRTFWTQVAATKPQHIITEAFPFQHDENAALAKTAGYSLRATDDFGQLFTAN